MIYSFLLTKKGESLMDMNHMSSLEAKHAHLDALIKQETRRPLPNQAELALLKKRKLKIKEEMSQV